MLAGCSSTTTTATTPATDVGYEDAYAADYYYPADVTYAGVYAGGWGYYGLAFAGSPGGADAPASSLPDGGLHLRDGGLRPGDGGISGAGLRGLGQAIRDLALGGDVCPGQATVTHPTSSAVCGQDGAGLTIAFNGCALSNGATLDGTVAIQLDRSASNAACDGTTTVSLGYTATMTNLTYTGASGAKIVLPMHTDTATIDLPAGQAPTAFMLQTSGEIQRFDSTGTMTSDRTYTGTRSFTAVSLANQSYTLGGTVDFTDKSGGTATVTGTDVMRDATCCKPVGGMLSVSRTGGASPGTHTWTFSSTCGSATLDGNTVTLPDCI
jgi:hypothetical protein